MKRAEGLREAEAVQRACWALEEHAEEWSEAGLHLKGFSVRMPSTEKPDWLMTIRAITSDGDVVAFISAESVGRLLTKLVGGIEGGSLTWKVDQYGR